MRVFIAAIVSIKKSSKSELSSRFLSRLKFGLEKAWTRKSVKVVGKFVRLLFAVRRSRWGDVVIRAGATWSLALGRCGHSRSGEKNSWKVIFAAFQL